MSDSDNRSALALKMINTLPRWGSWAASMREVDTPYGRIGYRQASIMWLLRKAQNEGELSTTTGIAAKIGVQNSVITRAGEHLESLGLLERTTSIDDRRRQFLSLTENGIKASEYIEDLYVDAIRTSLVRIKDDELEQLRAAVDQLDALIEKIISRRIGS